MSKNDCCSPMDLNTSVNVTVEVSKIVKYVCIAAVLIVGIIFGTRCYRKMLDLGIIDFTNQS